MVFLLTVYSTYKLLNTQCCFFCSVNHNSCWNNYRVLYKGRCLFSVLDMSIFSWVRRVEKVWKNDQIHWKMFSLTELQQFPYYIKMTNVCTSFINVAHYSNASLMLTQDLLLLYAHVYHSYIRSVLISWSLDHFKSQMYNAIMLYISDINTPTILLHARDQKSFPAEPTIVSKIKLT